METLIIVLKLVVALGILNVWVLRRVQPTPFRGKDAQTLREEFAAYGLPGWVYSAVGAVKIALAVALLISIWKPELELAKYSALALGGIMVVAFGMHLKVSDPAIKSLPALAVLAMCLGIVLL
jgi:hypothetical protein